MFASSRIRRSVAVAAAIALSIAGLSFAPEAANAYSRTSSRGILLNYINTERSAVPTTAWLQVPILDQWTQDYAGIYADCHGCASPTHAPSFTPADVDNATLLHATSMTSAGRILKLESLIVSHNAIAASDKWGSIGYVVHGHTGYLWVVGFDIAPSPEAPFNSLGSGTPTIHGKLRVGTTLSVTVPTLSPTPDSTGYEWLIHHGVTSTYAGGGATYTPSASDLGGHLTVIVTQYLTNTVPVSFTAKSGTIGHGHFGSPKLYIAGARIVGYTLDATVSSTPSADSFAYTWYRNDKKFVNVGNEYTLQAIDKGKRIDVKIVISKPGFISVTLRSHTSKHVAAA